MKKIKQYFIECFMSGWYCYKGCLSCWEWWVINGILYTIIWFWLGFASQTGIASYYTVKSSSNLTASGEIYNENDLTCAIWDIKFGTKIEVINLDNNKKVIVRVNDRGPHKRLNRLIDLSKRAFEILSDNHLEKGLLKVKIRILK